MFPPIVNKRLNEAESPIYIGVIVKWSDSDIGCTPSKNQVVGCDGGWAAWIRASDDTDGSGVDQGCYFEEDSL